MMNGRKIISTIIFLLAFTSTVNAQFYNQGRGRTSTRWQQIDSTSFKIIYPQGYETRAGALAELMTKIGDSIAYGFSDGVQVKNLPIILHTQSAYSNGFVTWSPKREELVMTPPLDNMALLWSKHLAVHEWRHVVQISSLNHGITKAATWLLGEAGYGVGLSVLPRWIMEGDATLAETQFAEYGRGLQPDFTVEYRAIFGGGRKDFTHLDRWVNGSYKYHYPDIYRFGYQTIAAAGTYLGEDYFSQMLEYVGRWPIFIFPADIYLNDKHNTSFKKIATRAFEHLDSLWMPHSEVEENFEHISAASIDNYTQYSYPLATSQGLLSLRSSYAEPLHLYNSTTEKKMLPMGAVTSRPSMVGTKYYYTEALPHPIFEQVSFSAIKELDLENMHTKTYHPNGMNWCVTPISNGGFATISMDSLSNSYISFFDEDFTPTSEYRFDSTLGEVSLHSLAYDSLSAALYFIALDSRGMWIGGLRDGEQMWEATRPNVITISDLSASNGVLYFSSIQSGKNEIHALELASGVQSRLSQSKYGSNMPTASGNKLFFTTNTPSGAMIATIENNSPALDTVEWSRLPQNTINAQWAKWRVPKVDTMSTDYSKQKDVQPQRYRPDFPLHSWAPAAFDGDYLMQNAPMSTAFGVTTFFQSTLSTLQGYATYGWLNNSDWLKGRVEYKGLPLTISVGAEYGGYRQAIYGEPETPDPSTQTLARDPYFTTDASLLLPLNLSSGGYSRLLQPSLTFSYSNAKFYNPTTEVYDLGMPRYGASLWWSSYRNYARRDLAPRLGYALRANINGSFNDNMGTQYSLYARGYVPGLFENHSLSIRGAAQYQELKNYIISSKPLYLPGVNDNSPSQNYFALVGDYSFPVLYPDWGWDSVIYFKRLRANLVGGYSWSNTMFANGLAPEQNYTYGVELGIDFTLMRAYDQSVTLNFLMPNGEFFFGLGYALNF